MVELNKLVVLGGFAILIFNVIVALGALTKKQSDRQFLGLTRHILDDRNGAYTISYLLKRNHICLVPRGKWVQCQK